MARFTNGWVKIHRKLLTEEWSNNLDGLSKGLLLELLLMANLQDTKAIRGKNLVIIKRGEILTSLTELSAKMKFGRKMVSNRLKILEILGTIIQKRDNGGLIITICNYNKYQDQNNDEGQRRDNGGTTEEHDRDNGGTTEGQRRNNGGTRIEELKNLKKEKNVKKSKNLRSNTASAPESNSAKKIIELYCEKYKQRFGRYPVITGKEAGAAKNLSKAIAEKDVDNLISGYFALSDAWVVQRMYPLDVLQGASIINRIMAKEAGVDVSQQKSQEYQKRMEYKTITQKLLKDYEDGKIP